MAHAYDCIAGGMSGSCGRIVGVSRMVGSVSINVNIYLDVLLGTLYDKLHGTLVGWGNGW